MPSHTKMELLKPLFPGDNAVDQLVEIIKVRLVLHYSMLGF